MPTIKLQSSDFVVFEVDYDVAKAFGIIKTMVENLGLEEKDEEIVPLPKVKAVILKKVLDWAHHHKDEPPFVDDPLDRRTDDISIWDADFLKVDQPILFEMMLAANYLDIQGLLNLTCKHVANMIKGKSTQEIRRQFNIRNDFTPAEEERVRLENLWCEDNK